MSEPVYVDLGEVPDDTDVPADGDDSIPPEDRDKVDTATYVKAGVLTGFPGEHPLGWPRSSG